jgi:hypothetical protein
MQGQVIIWVVKIAVYTDEILISFLFHILRFQVSGAGMKNSGADT